MSIVNYGTRQVANRAFIPLAYQAGLHITIASLVGLAKDEKTLLGELKDALAENNAPLADALNSQTLRAFVKFLETLDDSPVVSAENLPTMLDEAGPASVTAGRDGGEATQINIGFSEPPNEYTAEIYLDGIYQKDSTQSASNGTVFDILSGVEDDAQPHNVRVLFRDANGATTRFGPIANFT